MERKIVLYHFAISFVAALFAITFYMAFFFKPPMPPAPQGLPPMPQQQAAPGEFGPEAGQPPMENQARRPMRPEAGRPSMGPQAEPQGRPMPPFGHRGH